jgi:hypothetical protein
VPLELTAVFDGEGNLGGIVGRCEHARLYGSMDLSLEDTERIVSAAIDTTCRSLDPSRGPAA